MRYDAFVCGKLWCVKPGSKHLVRDNLELGWSRKLFVQKSHPCKNLQLSLLHTFCGALPLETDGLYLTPRRVLGVGGDGILRSGGL